MSRHPGSANGGRDERLSGGDWLRMPGPGFPESRVHARRPVDRDGGFVHRLPSQGEGDRHAH